MSAGERPGHVTTWDVDSGEGSPTIPADASIAYVVLRSRGRPVGRVVLEPPYPEDPSFWRHVARRTSPTVEPVRGIPESEISVVIATRDRPLDLDRCLAALRDLEPAPREIVVSDSASRDRASVAEVAAHRGARLVRLERPGLSIARNAGAAAATGRVVAFLDDDCFVDPWYLRGIGVGFETDSVWAVTGQLLPAELDTRAQRLFLRYSHMDRRGFAPRRFSLAQRESRHWPLDAWRMGSGGNVAVRKDRFHRLGGFCPALGLGTPSLGGEDLFFLWSVIRLGGEVVYRPDAMAWHRHHRDLDALRRVMFGYGSGHRAFLRAAGRAGASTRALLDYRASYWFDRAKRLLRAISGSWPVPPELVVREAWGHLAGGRLARRAEKEAS